MKIKNSTHQKRNIIIITAIIVAAGLAVATYVVYASSNQNADNKAPQESSAPTNQNKLTTEEEQAAGNQAKSHTLEQSPAPSTDPASPKNVNLQISASNQNGSVYQLRILVNSVVPDGTCSLTLTKDSTKVTKTANIQPLAQSSTCQGFDIPTAELSPGIWQVNVELSGSGVAGSTSGTIEVK